MDPDADPPKMLVIGFGHDAQLFRCENAAGEKPPPLARAKRQAATHLQGSAPNSIRWYLIRASEACGGSRGLDPAERHQGEVLAGGPMGPSVIRGRPQKSADPKPGQRVAASTAFAHSENSDA